MHRTPIRLAVFALFSFAISAQAGPGLRSLEGPEIPTAESPGVWRRTLAPASTSGFASVYDPHRARWVLAGMDGTAAQSEIWTSPVSGDIEWTAGEAANRITPGLLPLFSAWDGAADRILVLLQPSGSALAPYEAWECARGSGDTWRKLEPAGEAPAPRVDPLLCWDSARRRLFLLGGRGSDGQLITDGLWMLSFEPELRWDRVSVEGPDPTARVNAGIAFVEDRQRLVLFGGAAMMDGIEHPRSEDVWFLDLAAEFPEWSLVAWRAGGPGAGDGSTVIPDPKRDRFLVFGGSFQGDGVWQMSLSDPGTWTRVGSGTPMAANRNVAQDDASNSILLQSATDLALWRLDVATMAWTQVDTGSSTTPGFRGPLAMDPRDGTVLSIGFKAGFIDGTFRIVHTVTKYDPADPGRLEILAPAGTPPDRILGSAVWDPLRRRWIFVGTTGSATALDGVWTLETEPVLAWDVLPTVGLGPIGERLTVLHERDRDRLVVLEEDPATLGVREDALSRMRVWTLALRGPSGTPARWTLEPIGGPVPPAHNLPAVALDLRRDRLVLFGGARFIIAPQNDGKVYDDVWSLRLAPPMSWTLLLPEDNSFPKTSSVAADLDPWTDRIGWIGGEQWELSEPEYFWTGRDPLRTLDLESGLPNGVFQSTGYERVPSGRTVYDAFTGCAFHFPYRTAWEWTGTPRIDARLSLRRLTAAPRAQAPVELIVHGDDRFDPSTIVRATVEVDGLGPLASPGNGHQPSADVDGDGFADRKFLFPGQSIPTGGRIELRARTNSGVRVIGFADAGATQNTSIRDVLPALTPGPAGALPVEVRLIRMAARTTVEIRGGEGTSVEVDVYDVRGRRAWGTSRDRVGDQLLAIELPSSSGPGLHFVRVRAGGETRVLRHVTL